MEYTINIKKEDVVTELKLEIDIKTDLETLAKVIEAFDIAFKEATKVVDRPIELKVTPSVGTIKHSRYKTIYSSYGGKL